MDTSVDFLDAFVSSATVNNQIKNSLSNLSRHTFTARRVVASAIRAYDSVASGDGDKPGGAERATGDIYVRVARDLDGWR